MELHTTKSATIKDIASTGTVGHHHPYRKGNGGRLVPLWVALEYDVVRTRRISLSVSVLHLTIAGSD